jgi:hypothetical protein
VAKELTVFYSYKHCSLMGVYLLFQTHIMWKRDISKVTYDRLYHVQENWAKPDPVQKLEEF